MTTPLATPGYYTETTERGRRSPEPSRNSAQALLDPTLLQDLAEALDFLHRQVDDTESELERSREQSLAFEQDARRWQDEAARLRGEAGQTREALDVLRQEFEQTKEGSARQSETVQQLASEMAELRAARSQVDELAAEQQRALVLSLEILKRAQAHEQTEHSEIVEIAEKDRLIHELTQLVQAAGEEGTRIDNELASARAELAARESAWTAVNAELETARVELASVSARAGAASAPVADDQSSELAKLRVEIEARQEEFARELAVARSETAAKQGDLESARVELEVRATQWDAVQLRLEELEAELAARRSEGVAHEAAPLDDDRNELEAARLEIATTRAHLDASRTDLASHRSELSAINSELEATRLQLTATQGELESANAERTILKAKAVESAQARPSQDEIAEVRRKLRDAEAEIVLQNTEVESRGAIITALETALEEQISALRGLEDRFLAYAEQVQALQLQRMEVPNQPRQGLVATLGRLFSPSKRRTQDEISPQ